MGTLSFFSYFFLLPVLDCAMETLLRVSGVSIAGPLQSLHTNKLQFLVCCVHFCRQITALPTDFQRRVPANSTVNCPLSFRQVSSVPCASASNVEKKLRGLRESASRLPLPGEQRSQAMVRELRGAMRGGLLVRCCRNRRQPGLPTSSDDAVEEGEVMGIYKDAPSKNAKYILIILPINLHFLCLSYYDMITSDLSCLEKYVWHVIMAT